MTTPTRRLHLEEFVQDVAGVLQRVAERQETVVIEKDGTDLITVKPAVNTRKRRSASSLSDRAAFLSSFGAWKGVDAEQFQRDNASSRKITSRPPVEL